MLTACEENDNYDAPDGGIYGCICDKLTGEPIPMPVEGNSGVMVSMYELNSGATKSIDFRARQDGSFVNDMIFNGEYRVRIVNGPFVGIVEDYVNISGRTEFNVYATPFGRIDFTPEITDNNTVNVTYTAEAVNDVYKVSEVYLMWNYSSVVDVNNAYHAGMTAIDGAGNGTASYDLLNDKEFVENFYKIVSNGRKVYLRMGIAVTYGDKTYVNYSQVKTITVNDLR